VNNSLSRVKLRFAGLEIEFTDRDRGIQQVLEFAERSTWYPIVVFGPEGCGKTSWLKQSVEVLRKLGFDTIYIDPMHRDFITYTDVWNVARRFAEAAAGAVDVAGVKLATLAIDSVKELLSRWRKRRVSVLVDDVFQAIGLDKASIYVKSLLNLIEYPPQDYEKIVVVAATSEGFSRWEIGRHRWALLRPMWNMSRKGFEELYEKLPNPKPPVEEVWRLVGGNPDALRRLYQAGWNADNVAAELAKSKRLTKDFVRKWGQHLRNVVDDPDNLWGEEVPEELVNELTARNLIVYDMYDRDPWFWIDEPPPERDLEIGVGRYVAWQTPLHREAVKKALEEIKHTSRELEDY
jgi:hypothetical protein